MKEKIENFSKGKFQYELSKLLLSEEKLQLTVVAGQQCRGSFQMTNSRQWEMEVFLFCDEEEMELSCESFRGQEGEVSYCYHGEYLSAGQQFEGAILLVSSLGEVRLPYEVTVIEPEFHTSIGPISDLFQFTGLAQTHWEEARKVFLSEQFADAFLKTTEERLLYRSLSGSASADHAMEEFLRTIRKKSPVQLRIEKKEQEYHLASRTMRDTILIHKDGWGLIDGRVTAEGAFLTLEKDHLEQEDFTAGVYELPFILNPEGLDSPRSMARIKITTADQELTVEFPVYGAGRRKLYANGRKKKEYVSKLVSLCLEWKLGRLSKERYASEGRTLLYALEVVEENPLLELVSVHLNLVGGREREAQEQLLRLAREEEEMGEEIQDIYHYLCSEALQGSGSGRIGVKERQAGAASGKWAGAKQSLGLWYKGLFSLMVPGIWQEKKQRGSTTERLQEARELFEQGCRSPFLYLEAWKALKEMPDLLVRLEDFELQVMNWARKKALWAEELSARYVYLAEGEKQGRRLEYVYLEELYRQRGSREVLQAVCSLLLRQDGNSRDFVWYRRGVEAGLKLTGLYEAYMDTFPWESDKELDTRIYTYFWKDNSLNTQKKALLYSHIVSRREQRQSVYENYREQIQEFARERLSAGQVSPELAQIYEDQLEQPEFRQEAYRKLPSVMFRCMVTCDTPGMRGVCVCHEEENGEQFVPFVQGSAYIDIYTENVGIALEDEAGNRYAVSRPYEWKRLMQPGGFLTACYEAGNRDRRLLLALFSRTSRLAENKQGEEIELYRELLALDRLKPYCRNQIMSELIRYCHEQLEGSLLEGYLKEYDLGHAKREERLQILDMMLLRDMYLPAWMAVRSFGYKGLNLRYLQRLCSRQVSESEGADPFLIRLCWYLFQHGKTDSVQMEYLTRYYEGSTEHLYWIWSEAGRIGLRAASLEERLLSQMLFSEHILPDATSVYRSYVRGTGASSVREGKMLVRAFLSYLAYRYLVSDQAIHGSLFLDMQNEVFYDDTQLCKAAALKHYSRLLTLTEQEQEFAQLQMERMVKNGCLLPFFQGFAGKCRIPAAARNKSYAVYITDPDTEVTLHYRILDGDQTSDYQTERMKDVFFGIHIKDLLLFYGERVQYYITRIREGQEEVTESGILELEQAEIGAAIGTRGDEEEACQLINLMLMAREVGDDTTQFELMQQYIRQNYIKKKLFQPL